MFGYDDNELVGSSAKILFNDDDAFDEFSDQLSAGQQDGQTRRIYTCQRHKDGSRRYSKISYRPPFKGSNLIVGVFIDITEKRLSQARLRDVSKQLELILEASELGTWDWDVVSGSMTVNERWCAMLGMEAFPAEVTVATWCERVHPADLEGVMAAYKCHYEGNTAFYETEHRLRHNDGHWVWVLSHGKVVSRGQNNQPLRAAGTHLDISHRKRIESESFSLLAQMEQLIRQIVPARAQVPLSPSLTKDLASYGLSKRQQQILAKVVNGQRSTEIALELGISKSTVVTHRRDVMRKLKIRTMAELTRFAIRNGIMES
jgi:PAS domain S-box-containing protein